ncbi:Di-trans-poly-cis-decaprenylcistransferase-like protein, partial [Cynara cardunculus var. scolymus]
MAGERSKLPLWSSHILHTSAHLYAVLFASISPSPDRGEGPSSSLHSEVQLKRAKIPYTMDVARNFQETFGRITPHDSRVFLLLWHALHLILRVLYIAREILSTVESYLITNGLLKAYDHLNLDRVKYLGVVIDSDEARQTSEVIELLEWLSAIGIKKVCLYDREGVLKKSKEVIVERFSSAKLYNVWPMRSMISSCYYEHNVSLLTVFSCPLMQDDSVTDPIDSKKQMDFEFVSISDGKEAVAKAANVLFKKYYLDGDTEKPFFTETYLNDALKALGAVEPDPDLLLIYGPARCHLGFPAWRIRYTEMTTTIQGYPLEGNGTPESCQAGLRAPGMPRGQDPTVVSMALACGDSLENLKKSRRYGSFDDEKWIESASSRESSR